MPSPLPRQDRRKPFARAVPSVSAFPEIQAGRLLRHPFRGLLSVHSRYGLHARRVAIATLYTGGSDGFVTSTAAPIATGWCEQFPGETFTRCGPTPFHGALNNLRLLEFLCGPSQLTPFGDKTRATARSLSKSKSGSKTALIPGSPLHTSLCCSCFYATPPRSNNSLIVPLGLEL